MLYLIMGSVTHEHDEAIDVFQIPSFYLVCSDEDLVEHRAREIIDMSEAMQINMQIRVVDPIDLLSGDEKLQIEAYRGACETCVTSAYDKLASCRDERMQ